MPSSYIHQELELKQMSNKVDMFNIVDRPGVGSLKQPHLVSHANGGMCSQVLNRLSPNWRSLSPKTL